MTAKHTEGKLLARSDGALICGARMIGRPDFDPNHPHGWTTRDGRGVRVLCTDGPAKFSIVGLIDGEAYPGWWTSNGHWLTTEERSPSDLINAPTPKRRVKGALYGFEDQDGKLCPVYLIREGETCPVYTLPGGATAFAIPIDHEIDGDEG